MEVVTGPTRDINWTLIQELSAKPHKHLNIAEGEQYGLMIDGRFEDCCNGVNEVMQEARTAHHLCDMAGIPEGDGYSAHIDARVFLLVREAGELNDRLARIAEWHARETAPGGMVGDYCTECMTRWPCDTRRMADGSWTEADNEAEAKAWER